MNKGLLIYTPEDYEKNKWFAHELLENAPLYGLTLKLVLTSQLILGISDNGLFATSSLEALAPWESLDFIINRSRDTLIATHFEQMGCRVFNPSIVTDICNHKGKTHQLINSQSIASVSTFLGKKQGADLSLLPLPYPLILKSVSGHGGSEVFMVTSSQDLKQHLTLLPSEDYILQVPCGQPGTDIRVFTLGKDIIAAVKRHHPHDFKSNYSLGGTAVAYTLTPKEQALVQHILRLLPFDLIGIDFILDEKGHFLFNEIEDVVGTRTLYLNYPDINIVSLYLDYIKGALS